VSWQIPILSPISLFAYHIFKYCHLEHHKHTNDEEKDPDKWTHPDDSSSIFHHFLRWLTLDFAYLGFSLKHRVEIGDRRLLEGITGLLVVIIMTIYLKWLGGVYFQILLWHWFFPSRIAVAFLAYSFDYLPHSPLKTTAREDRWKTTAFLLFPLQPLFSVLLFFQDYHVVHHLWPNVPFYQYISSWRKHETEIRERGVPPKKIFAL